MSSSRVIIQVADKLREDWAAVPALAGLTVLAAERNVDISSATAILRQVSIGRFPEAPKTHRTAEVVLTIVSPREDFDRAAADLDGWVFAALDYLDVQYRPPEEARSVLYVNKYLAYDITFTVITSKE